MSFEDETVVMPFQQGIIEFDSNPIKVVFNAKTEASVL
jgi:hypothetical protein